MYPSSRSPVIICTSTIYPKIKSSLKNLKLSVSDVSMLSCHYIQNGLLFPRPPMSTDTLVSLLEHSLSQTLTHFPPLAGRLTSDSHHFVYIDCKDAGVTFIHARATYLSIQDILSPSDVPHFVKEFFTFNETISCHPNPLVAIQVTELFDGIFISCTINHAVIDGTSFWNFFNAFAEISRGSTYLSRPPDFRRTFFRDALATIPFTKGPVTVTFNAYARLRERIFHFSREAITKLKTTVNFASDEHEQLVEVSSFHYLCALLWRSITHARKLAPSKKTTFRMIVNCRHRLHPSVNPYYFGNAIQSIPIVALTKDVLSNDIHWCAKLLHDSDVAYDGCIVDEMVQKWEQNPHFFPLGNSDGTIVTMESSLNSPIYDNDFGWGSPLTVRSGLANKFDGKVSAYPGKEGDGSVDLEVCLAPETMAGLEMDEEIMQYVSWICCDH